MWQLNNTLLKNQWITAEIKEEVKKYLETNESTVIQNLWDAAKAFPGEKFTGIQSFSRKQKKKKISNKQPNLTPTATTE